MSVQTGTDVETNILAVSLTTLSLCNFFLQSRIPPKEIVQTMDQNICKKDACHIFTITS